MLRVVLGLEEGHWREESEGVNVQSTVETDCFDAEDDR